MPYLTGPQKLVDEEIHALPYLAGPDQTLACLTRPSNAARYRAAPDLGRPRLI